MGADLEYSTVELLEQPIVVVAEGAAAAAVEKVNETGAVPVLASGRKNKTATTSRNQGSPRAKGKRAPPPPPGYMINPNGKIIKIPARKGRKGGKPPPPPPLPKKAIPGPPSGSPPTRDGKVESAPKPSDERRRMAQREFSSRRDSPVMV